MSSKNEDPEAVRLRGVLSTADRDQLEDILRELTPEKVSVGDAMMWCLEHADCAKEIVQCIYESLGIKETPLNKKVCFFTIRILKLYKKFFHFLKIPFFRLHVSTLSTIFWAIAVFGSKTCSIIDNILKSTWNGFLSLSTLLWSQLKVA